MSGGPGYKPVAQDAIHGGGKVETARPNIPLRDVRELKIPIPSLLEQNRIVAELDALQAQVDVLKRLQGETAAELDALPPAILDRAFKGDFVRKGILRALFRIFADSSQLVRCLRDWVVRQ